MLNLPGLPNVDHLVDGFRKDTDQIVKSLKHIEQLLQKLVEQGEQK